jgi:hypothetical protein
MRYYLRLVSDPNRIVTQPGTANNKYWETRAEAQRYIEDHYQGLQGPDFELEIATETDPEGDYQIALESVLKIVNSLPTDHHLQIIHDLFQDYGYREIE